MELLFLGSGTSNGVPVIACNCKVCKSRNPKDKRNRASVYIHTNDNKYILIDAGPEFRIQALKFHIKQIDLVLLTHSHADHLHGIDDLRSFSCTCFKRSESNSSLFDAPPIPICTNQKTLTDLQNRFDYLFRTPKEGGGYAKIQLKEVSESFEFENTVITPIPMLHGHLETVGWLITETINNEKKSIAYLTDCSFISDESIELIRKNCGDLQHLIIDGLRITTHSTHFNYLQAMEAAAKIGAKQTWITHITHSVSHKDTAKYLKAHKAEFPGLNKIQPSWDGLKIKTK